jgi:pSer/pThr/pTyr-binding forkhead associated (FHA) protein
VIRAVYVESGPGGKRKEKTERAGGRGGRGVTIIEPVERAGERFDVDHDETLSIGRSATCDVVIAEDIYASTVHTRLRRDDDGFFAEDLASTNGTYVNAERIFTPTRLTRGDVLQVGSTVFEVIR